jgi:serine phosphatase RsbU (regulator of sigma subunit)
MDLSKELNAALARNLRHKAGILASVFAFILLLQVVALSYAFTHREKFSALPFDVIWIGPLMLLLILALELYSYKYFSRLLTRSGSVSSFIAYSVTFVEISFPTIVLFFVNIFIGGKGLFTTAQVLNSPPVIMYFIMIILSSLLLDFKVSVFAGFVAGAQYVLVCWYYLKDAQETGWLDLPNSFIKGIFILLCGVIAGFVSQKIKEALLSSLRAKDELIHKLDHLVNEKTTEVRKQKEEIEEKNKDITASITYAQRIQRAILPPVSQMKGLLGQHFILYKPKDIVSGDFYWVEQSGDATLFAAVDCTGHGVPGAFMSIVGHNILTQVVFEKKINSPALILDRLNEEVNRTLRQRGNAEVKDGMDIALCSLDREKNKLYFSGANNPLYFIRRGELKEIKGDKFPIGETEPGNKNNFTQHELDLLKGDSIYIFSDGYADQFGGPKGKKFKYKQLQELLLSIQQHTMDEQLLILEKTINDWKGDLEQVDDILVIGLRF